MPSPSDRILLVLDLDETLVYATEKALERPADFKVAQYHVYQRPHLDTFLEACAGWFDVAVWSSASDSYVEAVVANIFPHPHRLKFVWGRSRATYRHVGYNDEYQIASYDPEHFHYIKTLSKVRRKGWPLERVLIVDDTPEKCIRNYGNAIYPAPFEGDPEDKELPLLATYLASLCDVPNVRKIEKRHWRYTAQRLQD